METLKIRTDRILLNWRDIETRPGVRDWSANRCPYGALAAHGIRLLPFVWGSPEWVGSGTLAQPPTGTAADRNAWQNFLRAAVAALRAGRHLLDQRSSLSSIPGPPPLPVTAWQIWNEPNLKKYFSPGATVQASAQKYATLLQLSHDAITAIDPNAKIVLAGMPDRRGLDRRRSSSRTSTTWPGSRPTSTSPPCTPTRATVTGVQNGITKFRGTMNRNGDSGAESGSPSSPGDPGRPTSSARTRGSAGQRDHLDQSYQAVPTRPQGVEPPTGLLVPVPRPARGLPDYARLCSICGTAGLLRNNRTAKPAYAAFRSFTAGQHPARRDDRLRDRRPGAPPTTRPRPSPSAPTRPGSTFLCRYDANPFGHLQSPNTKATPLTSGSHTFSVKAVDARRERVGREDAHVHRRHGASEHDHHLGARDTAARPPTTRPPSGSAPPRRARPSSAASTPSRSRRARGRATPTPPPPRSPAAATASRSRRPTRRRTSTRPQPSGPSPSVPD